MKRHVQVAVLALAALGATGRSNAAGVEAARRSQRVGYGPGCLRRHQVRNIGSGIPRHESPGRGLLESGEYRVWRLHSQGHLYADGAEAATPTITVWCWRQRSGRFRSRPMLYFVVAQDGTWLIKRRDGDATSNVSAKTPSPR